METQYQLLFIVLLLALLAEVTYLVVKLPRQSSLKKQGRPIFIDTSVLIDGRIIAVAKSGFIGDTLVIPRSVVGELQFLADNADHDKRARARHGLDIVTELQNMSHVNVEILQDGSKANEGVDERLLTLAKKHAGAICTIDYNLNKVAVVEGIDVLNVNELAQSLRMAYLPGEKMMLELVQKGQDAHQGVGYLSDGTMVVVENSSKSIGQTVEVEFIRSLQTAAGKMMFARPVEKHVPKTQKPTGKKLVAKTPPAQPQTPKAVTAAATPSASAPATFHSDAAEAKKAHHRHPKKHTGHKQGQKSSHANSNKKKTTSVDREAALLDLVDKQ